MIDSSERPLAIISPTHFVLHVRSQTSIFNAWLNPFIDERGGSKSQRSMRHHPWVVLAVVLSSGQRAGLAPK